MHYYLEDQYKQSHAGIVKCPMIVTNEDKTSIFVFVIATYRYHKDIIIKSGK